MQRLTLCTILTAGVLGVAGVAHAQDGLTAKIWNEDNRGHVQVDGSAAQFPDGTELRAEVVVKGNYPRPLVGAFFRVRVKGGRYTQTEVRRAVFAPLSYTVKLKLQVANQAPAVRKLLQTKFGWQRNHTEPLDFVDVSVGTEGEKASFRLTTLHRLRGLSEELLALVDVLEPGLQQPVADNPGWEALFKSFDTEARALGGRVQRFSREYAVLPDKDLVDTLSKSLNNMHTIARHMQRGKDPSIARRDIGRVWQWADGLHADVNGRLPVEERNEAPKRKFKSGPADKDEGK